MAGSDWDKDDWENVKNEGRFDLGKGDGGDSLVNDNFDKHDHDNCDDCGDNRPCNVSIIHSENLMSLFSIKWRWSL